MKFKWPVIILSVLTMISSFYFKNLTYTIVVDCVLWGACIFLFVFARRLGGSRRNMIIAMAIVVALAVVLYFVVKANAPDVPVE